MAQAHTSPAHGCQVRLPTNQYRFVDTLALETTVGAELVVSSGSPAYPANPNTDLTFPAPGLGTLTNGLCERNLEVHFPEHGAFQRPMMQTTAPEFLPARTISNITWPSGVRNAGTALLPNGVSSTGMASGLLSSTMSPNTFNQLGYQVAPIGPCGPSTRLEYVRTPHQTQQIAYNSSFVFSPGDPELSAYYGGASQSLLSPFTSKQHQSFGDSARNESLGNQDFLMIPPVDQEVPLSGRRCSASSINSAPSRLGSRETNNLARSIECEETPQDRKFLK